ncbi:MAG: GNAT family protein [Methylococcales bacterium]|nr:GNAT family protein [Methylococcales bacterium]
MTLVRTQPAYLDFIHAAYSDDAFMDLYRLGQSRTLSKKALKQRIEQEAQTLPQSQKRLEWVILETQQTQPIGLASLADYQATHGRAELLVGIVDSAQAHRRSALEATLLVMDFAFNLAQLHKLLSFVYDYNHYAQRNTLHLGFRQEGFLVDHINTRKGLVSLYQNALLRREFVEHPRLARLSKRLLGRDITRIRQPTAHPLAKHDLNLLSQRLRIPSEAER